MSLSFEWDEAKAASNFAKHGLKFTTAIQVFGDRDHLVVPTIREVDGEPRLKAIGLIEDRLYTVVFVKRGERLRLISARRANSQEGRKYGDRPLHF